MMDRRTFTAGTAAAFALACAGPAAAAGGSSVAGPAHRFLFSGIDGQPLPLSSFAGRLILVANTASECAYTGQYRDLQALYETYAARGLVVIGTPSNDFGGQEPGSEQEIAGFCTAEYGVTFPLTTKVRVRGGEAHPFYRWAAETLGTLNAPRWNFHKYLVGPDGRLLKAFPSAVSPRDPRVVAAIEANLPG